MKFLITSTLLVCLASSLCHAETREVTLEEITARVSKENLYVLENAQRVYQAKQGIQLARRNLLPRLNIWRFLSNSTNPRSMLGIVEDIAPFLVPNNWLRVKEEKLFSQATQHGYKSLWGNELLTARGLFMQATLEERLANSLIENAANLRRVRDIVRVREDFGAMPAGSTRLINVQLLAAQDEVRTVKQVTKENRSQLAFLLGFPGNDEAVPAAVRYLSKSESPELRYEDYEQKVLDSSPEIKQFNSLIKAAKYVKRERYFSFLGSSTMSRGVGGGVFDNLPQQDGLGFGLGASLRIVRAQKRILQLQKEAVEETIRKNLKLLIDSYNMDLVAREEASERVQLTRATLESLESRMDLGDTVDAFELVQAADARMEALTTYHTVEVRLLLNKDRLLRMTFADAFEKP